MHSNVCEPKLLVQRSILTGLGKIKMKIKKMKDLVGHLGVRNNFGDSISDDEKLEVKISFLSYFATQGVARLLTFYFTTKDRPFSKPHGPWPAGIGGP